VNTFTSRDAGAAGELALARLDDDGAPPAVTGHSHGHYAIRRGHTEKVAGRLAQTAAAASGEEAEQTPTLLGAG
jgi:methyl coenzyme M reductase alpha subunit